MFVVGMVGGSRGSCVRFVFFLGEFGFFWNVRFGVVGSLRDRVIDVGSNSVWDFYV